MIYRVMRDIATHHGFKVLKDVVEWGREAVAEPRGRRRGLGVMERRVEEARGVGWGWGVGGGDGGRDDCY